MPFFTSREPVLHEMRRALRSGPSPQRLQGCGMRRRPLRRLRGRHAFAGRDGGPFTHDLALARNDAGAPRRGHCFPRRGRHSAPSREAPRGERRDAAALRQGGGGQSDRIVQGARLGVAVTMAKALGARKIALPTAGNAGGAAAAYAAVAGLACHVFMPKDTPKVFKIECEAYGAHVTLVDGLIDDCGRIVAQRKDAEGWFDVSTLKEPYRVEGKKTMGYELAEDFGWTLPEVVVYPTGGGDRPHRNVEGVRRDGAPRPGSARRVRAWFPCRPRAVPRFRRPSPRARTSRCAKATRTRTRRAFAFRRPTRTT